jgi:hypothetical protein
MMLDLAQLQHAVCTDDTYITYTHTVHTCHSAPAACGTVRTRKGKGKLPTAGSKIMDSYSSVLRIENDAAL